MVVRELRFKHLDTRELAADLQVAGSESIAAARVRLQAAPPCRKVILVNTRQMLTSSMHLTSRVCRSCRSRWLARQVAVHFEYGPFNIAFKHTRWQLSLHAAATKSKIQPLASPAELARAPVMSV